MHILDDVIAAGAHKWEKLREVELLVAVLVRAVVDHNVQPEQGTVRPQAQECVSARQSAGREVKGAGECALDVPTRKLGDELLHGAHVALISRKELDSRAKWLGVEVAHA